MRNEARIVQEDGRAGRVGPGCGLPQDCQSAEPWQSPAQEGFEPTGKSKA